MENWRRCLARTKEVSLFGCTVSGRRYKLKWSVRRRSAMSEDRLDKALEAMKNEDVNASELKAAHDRVREQLGISGESAVR